MKITNNQALKYADSVMYDFQNEMKDSFGDLYFLSLSEAIRVASVRDSQFMYLLGQAAYEWSLQGMDIRRQREAMERVASWQEDIVVNFPATPQELIPPLQLFLDGMKEEMSSFDLSFFPDKGVQVVKNIGKKAEQTVEFVGNVTGNIGKTIENTTESFSKVSKYSWIFIAAALVGVLGIGYSVLKKKADDII